jgi:hypothetical protein
MQYKSVESDINIRNTTTSCIKKQEVLGRTNHLLSLDTTPTTYKTTPPTILCCYGNVFTELLPGND